MVKLKQYKKIKIYQLDLKLKFPFFEIEKRIKN